MASFRIERTIEAPLKKVWDAADFTKSVGPYTMEVRNEGNPERIIDFIENECISSSTKTSHRHTCL